MTKFVGVFVCVLVVAVGMAVAAPEPLAPELAVSADALTDVSEVIPPRGEKIAYTDPRSGEVTAIVTKSSDIGGSAADKSFSIAPIVGATGFSGAWHNLIGNQISFGLAVEVPVTSFFAVEMEGIYAEHQISYSNPYNLNDNIMHGFQQWQLGTNGKIYLSRRTFSPYLGGGLAALYYTNLSAGFAGRNRSYNEFIGAGQLFAGADLNLNRTWAIGLRGGVVLPAWDRPEVRGANGVAGAGYEEASAVDSSFYRIMGTVKINL